MSSERYPLIRFNIYINHSINVSIALMSCLNNKNLHQKPIAWFLIVALFVLVLLPIDIHVHHDLELNSHHGDGHAIHYHMLVNDRSEEHTSELQSH